MDDGRVAVDMVPLVEEECLALLRSRTMGRLAVVTHGSPQIFPVNYVVDGHTVAFRTAPGTKADAANLGMVALEIDDVDPVTHEGWVAEVRGLGREITAGIDGLSERMRALPLVPWVSGAKELWVAIVAPVFSGRRLVRVPS